MSTETLATSKGLLARVEHMYYATRSVIDALPDDRFDEALATGMTLRQVLAHLAAWEGTVPPRVAHVLETGEDLKQWEDVDGFNAKVFAETADAPIADLRARYARTHAELVDAVRSLDDRDVPALAIQVVEWNTTGHHPDHYPDLGAATRDAHDTLAAVRMGWRRFKAGVAALGVVGLDTATSSGWTYREMLGHIAEWEDLTRRRLEHLRTTGEVLRMGSATADDLNREFAERAASRPAMDVLADLDGVHERLTEEIARLAPEQLAAHDHWAKAIIAGNTYGHYAEHHVELFAGLPRTTAAALRRFDASWAIFRARVRDIGRAGLASATPAGWTYRDLLAHLANWMQHAARELSGEAKTWTDVDQENARAIEAHKLVGPEAMLDELDSSHRRVRQTIASLADARVRDRQTFNILAPYTYLAWEEHFAEMGITL